MTDGQEISAPIEVNQSESQAQAETVVDSSVENTQQATLEPATSVAPESEPKPVKTYSRDEVNKIVNAEKNRAYEKARREAFAESQRQQQQGSMQGNYVPPSGQYVSASDSQAGQGYSEQQIASVVYKLAQQEAMNNYHNKIASDFMSKYDAAKQDDPELEVKFQELEISKLGLDVVDILNSADNVGDVINEFYNHPRKLVDIELLAKSRPQAAKNELMKLAKSIKTNRESLARSVPKEPLSQVKPSITSSDSGKMTCSDMRKLKEYQW
jgi:predicted CopG family antitoxin